MTVRDEKGRPVLPVIEHFGAKPYQHRSDQRGSEDVAFLDRPPPPECVDPVLPGGCTARKVSMVVIAVLAWVSRGGSFGDGLSKSVGVGSVVVWLAGPVAFVVDEGACWAGGALCHIFGICD